MPRFATDDGKGTNDPAQAQKGPNGEPVSNLARNIWVTETVLSTLNTSYMAERLSLFSIIVGVALLLAGFGFAILAVGGALRNPDTALSPLRSTRSESRRRLCQERRRLAYPLTDVPPSGAVRPRLSARAAVFPKPASALSLMSARGPEAIMSPMRRDGKFRVVIAGGGVAALEAMIALRQLAEERIELTLVAPDTSFIYRPLTAAEPFGLGEVVRFPLETLTAGCGTRREQGALSLVSPDTRSIYTSRSRTLDYDALLVACGAPRA